MVERPVGHSKLNPHNQPLQFPLDAGRMDVITFVAGEIVDVDIGCIPDMWQHVYMALISSFSYSLFCQFCNLFGMQTYRHICIHVYKHTHVHSGVLKKVKLE